MNIAQALFLGIVQGLTEFLPVSSSGHLVILESFLGINIGSKSLMGFDIILHAGTLVGLLIIYGTVWLKMFRAFFNTDIPSQPGMTGEYRALFLSLIVATIPAVLAGVLLGDLIVDSFRSTTTVGMGLIVTALVLILGERYPQKHRTSDLGRLRALWIGIAQACALIPGLSRSGLTMGAGRMTGMSRRKALDFSFMMAVPVIAGATLLTLIDSFAGTLELPALSAELTGFFSSLIVSVVAILFLRTWIIKRSLSWFAVYLIPMGLWLIIF